MEYGLLRGLQAAIFKVPGQVGDSLSINMLILIGSLAYLLSFVAVHLLPDRKQTRATQVDEQSFPGPERWQALSPRLRRDINISALALGLELFIAAVGLWGMDPIAAVMMSFFGLAFLRKSALDLCLARAARR
jgi:hypothetical protein